MSTYLTNQGSSYTNLPIEYQPNNRLNTENFTKRNVFNPMSNDGVESRNLVDCETMFEDPFNNHHQIVLTGAMQGNIED